MGLIEFVGGRGLVLVAALCLAMVLATSASTFADKFTPYNSDGYHVQAVNDGQEARLVLDQYSASGFGSKFKYLFGHISMQIKLVPGDSAGTVTAYYLSSSEPGHDELDFEFLGNVSGQPYILQTNVFANGYGNREQRIYLWFDPSADFHTYGVLWNRNQILFQVDDKPIRVFKNSVDLAVPYLDHKPMGLYTSLWNGDQWATEGGRIKTNWTHAPFVASYRNFDGFDACVATDSDITPCTSTSNQWWDSSAYQTLDTNQTQQIKWVNDNYLVYDYCADRKRFPTAPPECSRNAV